MVSADQVLARPEGGNSTPASEEALAQYSSNVLKALYSTEISKQLGMDRQVWCASCQTSFFFPCFFCVAVDVAVDVAVCVGVG